MIRVISSPSISTIGFLTLILLTRAPVLAKWKMDRARCGDRAQWARATRDASEDADSSRRVRAGCAAASRYRQPYRDSGSTLGARAHLLGKLLFYQYFQIAGAGICQPAGCGDVSGSDWVITGRFDKLTTR